MEKPGYARINMPALLARDTSLRSHVNFAVHALGPKEVRQRSAGRINHDGREACAAISTIQLLAIPRRHGR